MKFTTDIEGLRYSCQHMRGQLDNLLQIERTLTSACQQLHGAGNFNAAEAHAINTAVRHEAGKLSRYIELVTYWADILELAMRVKYVPDPPQIDLPEPGLLEHYLYYCADFFNLDGEPGDMSIVRADLERATEWFDGLAARMGEGGEIAIDPLWPLIFGVEVCYSVAGELTRGVAVVRAEAIAELKTAGTFVTGVVDEIERTTIHGVVAVGTVIVGGVQNVVDEGGSILRHIGEGLQEGLKIAHDTVGEVIAIGGKTVELVGDFIGGIFKSAGDILGGIIHNLIQGFQQAMNGAAQAIVAGFDWLGRILLGPYIEEAGQEIQNEEQSEPKPVGSDENTTTYHAEIQLVVPIPDGVPIEFGGEATVTITRRIDPKTGHIIDVLTIKGKLKAGISTEPGGPHAAINGEGEATVELTFDETDTTGMGQMSVLLQTLGLHDGKVADIIRRYGSGAAALGTVAELGWFRDKITGYSYMNGVEAEAEVSLGDLLKVSGSAEILFGTGRATDEIDGKQYNTLDAKYKSEGSAGVANGSVEVGGGLELEGQLLLNTDGSLHKGIVSSTISVEGKINVLAELEALGIGAEVAAAIAKTISVEVGVKESVKVEFSLENLEALKGKNALEVLEFIQQHGTVKVTETTEASLGGGIDLDAGSGALKVKTQVSKGVTATIYPPTTNNLGSGQSKATLDKGNCVSAPVPTPVPPKTGNKVGSGSKGGGVGSW